MDNTGRRTGLVGEITIWILDIVKFEMDIHMEIPNMQLEMKVWSSEERSGIETKICSAIHSSYKYLSSAYWLLTGNLV